MEGSMFKSLDELREQIKAFGLERHEEKLVALAKPAIRMLPSLVEEDEIPIGSSKLGGNPDLPMDFEWKTYEGKPLTFIGQFKLSEIAPYDRDKELPAEGMLYFFYDIRTLDASHNGWHFVFIDETRPLIRYPHPHVETKYGDIQALPAHKLDFARSVSIPHMLLAFDSKLKEYLGLDFTDDDEERYWTLWEYEFSTPRHYFLGYSTPIQDTVEDPLSRLLFQVDTDYSLGITWGDAGTIYVCILKDHLISKQFDGVWTIMEFD
jgi:uncharacterized protein YwqG